jgi:ATP-dependent DNA ligase
MRTPFGVRFEVSVDATPRTYRDDRKIAIEPEDGEIVFHHACALGREGIVSTRLGAPYRSFGEVPSLA